MTAEDVKKELRELKHLERCVKVRETIKELRERRLKRLRSMAPSKERDSEISEIEDIIRSLSINDYIKKVNKLEKKYFGIISTLPPKEQIIVLECFVNGDKTYWQVGNQLGYSDEWVRAKVREIMNYIAEKMTCITEKTAKASS
ncbi:MAG: hypothetical protein IJ445_05375 [Clostridia bacterium]|nr:hypothetical protein [Clostridia bacterium]